MRDWIAGAMTVLGTLLVLGGAVTIILRTWWKPAPGDPAANPAPTTTASEMFGTPALSSPVPPVPARQPRLFGRLEPADRLIAWGIVLLFLAAIAAGAVGFNLGANAPVR